MSESNGKALSVPGLGKVLEALGLSAGVATLIDPSGTAGIAAATVPVAAAVVSHLADRQDERERKRTRLVLEDLQRRLKDLESPEPGPPDLFAEMLSRAIADDDERKVLFQGAVIEWVIRSKPRPDQSLVRIAMEAVSTLSFPELRTFVTWGSKGFGGRLKLEHGWNERVAMVRYNMLGLLTQDNMISPAFVTPIGKMLVEKCVDAIYSEREWEHVLQ